MNTLLILQLVLNAVTIVTAFIFHRYDLAAISLLAQIVLLLIVWRRT